MIPPEGRGMRYGGSHFEQNHMCIYLHIACKANGDVFKDIPEDILTPDFCAKVVKAKGIESISSLPSKYKNATFYTALVEIMPEAFRSIPKRFRTASLCKAVIKGLGYPHSLIHLSILLLRF